MASGLRSQDDRDTRPLARQLEEDDVIYLDQGRVAATNGGGGVTNFLIADDEPGPGLSRTSIPVAQPQNP